MKLRTYETIAREFIQNVINEGRLDEIGNYVSSDSVHHELDSVPEYGRGPDGLAQFIDLYRWAFPDLHISVDDVVANGDQVITRWRLQGTHQNALMGVEASGRKVDVSGVRIDRIRGGKIAESWMHWEAMQLLEQIGALPEVERNPQSVPYLVEERIAA